jgi:hypothetical protein
MAVRRNESYCHGVHTVNVNLKINTFFIELQFHQLKIILIVSFTKVIVIFLMHGE